MKKNLLIICLILGIAMMYACSKDDFTESELEETQQTDPDPEIADDPGDTDDDDLNANSQSIHYENAVLIAFSSNGASVTNPFENNGVTVENNNGHIVITSAITELELNYVLSGIIADGSVKIYGEKKFGLVLNGVGITNPNGAAINIQNKKKGTVTLVDNTNNRLIDGSTYTYTDGEDMKATFFSEGNVEIGGNGALEIRGKNKHGLCTDGALTITAGTINIKEAASDGIHTNDEITISGGTLTIRSVGDGIESESKTEPVSITAGDISIITTGEKGHAIKTKYNVEIESTGKVEITTYGAASKGIKPAGDITIRKGDITVNSAGDAIWDTDEQDISSAAGIKCDGNFLMEEGTLTLLSTGKGGKGINVDGTLIINGGTVTVTTTGDQYVYNRSHDTAAKAIKSDGNLTINGGNIKIRTSKTEAEGLESKAILTITGGEIDIEAYDDAINASTHIQVDGGNIYCNSATNDAIDSNGTLTVTGGVIVAAGASQPEGGFDCDNSRFTITGGTLIGIGGATSTPTAAYCTQRSLVFNSSSSNIQYIRIESTSGGQEVLTFKLPKTYSSRMTMLFSSPSLAANTGYTIYTGGTISGGTDFHGFYTGATYTKGTSAGTFTTGSAAGSVSTVGTSIGRP
ncbi:carbohydrate-binding domain-containing protein [Proteiniphilum sp. X52]|uniref:carbohydrate-binding domain-containing protein n=1 Tax=Proteiniphilum sp. X52 TaxID=2382159 RepID=UPI000F0A0337|nr:carbohydrate-binding domain-containing protein [Proteiniphilum sp. X52]RNC66503.1 carbohydrate-binding domain-containing protein [Proteiniphilum sp. X52]